VRSLLSRCFGGMRDIVMISGILRPRWEGLPLRQCVSDLRSYPHTSLSASKDFLASYFLLFVFQIYEAAYYHIKQESVKLFVGF
jgi:hypothetical protein